MTESKKKMNEYVLGSLHQSAKLRYDELYGGWKKEKLEEMMIKAPDFATYLKDIEALLPQKYLQGVRGAAPNVLYRALSEMDFDKTRDIIIKSQFISLSDFSKRYMISEEIVMFEWEDLWLTVSGINCWIADYRKIPLVLADDFATRCADKKYSETIINKKLEKLGAYNQCIAYGMIEAYHFVCKYLLFVSTTEQEYQTKLDRLHNSKPGKIILNIIQIWS